MNWVSWVMLAVGLIVGIIGGFAIGVWYLRKSVTNMQMDDKEIMQTAKRMGMNLSPRQLQMVKQQMKKSETTNKNNTPPATGLGKLGQLANFGKKKEVKKIKPTRGKKR